VDVHRRTLEALDWPFILETLASYARTERGPHAVRALEPLADPHLIAELLDAVEDVARVRDAEGHALRLGDVADVLPQLERAERKQVLEPAELCAVRDTAAAMADLGVLLARHRETSPTLARWAERIDVERELRRTLDRAFDEHGALSERTYPRLGELRRRITTLERRVRSTLERLLTSGELGDALQDPYITVRADRLVIPIKVHAKRFEIGIVHDSSRSGQTVYVEPHQVVPINNEMRVAEAELAAEERRILAELSDLVGRHAGALARALEATTDVDLAQARSELAVRLDATRPEVGDQGVIALRAARHPVLVLRGLDVVANDLTVDARRPVLVLTGPNAGGKTVALKTVGLASLLVRMGCFVPAAEGSRVDFFPEVLADIGDQQTVHADLSSFSGHLATLAEMLDQAGPGCLLLLDELASGTDPAQGGALARALLERFAADGARVVATTHYAQVKGMAAADDRVAIAAMEYRDERPTYRVVAGMAGESHALSVALHVGIDAAVVDRARAVMDEGERALHEALSALEDERARSETLARRAAVAADTLERREASLAEREARLKRHAQQLEQEAAAGFLERVREAEHEIGRIVAELQRGPSPQAAERARLAVAELGDGLAAAVAEPPPAAQAPPVPGDRVRVRGLALSGEVVSTSEREVEIRAGNMTVRAKLDEVENVGTADGAGAQAGNRRSSRRAAAATSKDVRPSRGGSASVHAAITGSGRSGGPALYEAVRLAGNTLDLRGERVEAGLARLDRFLDDAVLRNVDAVFVLHGHGTGAMKDAVRRALEGSPYVARSGPAQPEQGGDAFTVAVLRG
jgi:DNA mismatch repair protein MutS2